MKTFLQKITTPLKILIISGLVILGTHFIMAAVIVDPCDTWCNPPASPPSNNRPAPINVSINFQDKLGGISLGGLRVNNGGSAIVDGKISAGYATPPSSITGVSLNIAEKIKISDPSYGNNKVLASDATGVGTWQTLAYLCAQTGACGSATSTGGGGVGGSGTVNYVPKWATQTTLGNSQIYDINQNVGIGNTAPTEKLQVSGAIMGKSGDAAAFNANHVGYTFDGETDGGMFSPADGTIVFATNGSERLRVNASGNVGIGTPNPGAKLDIAGSGGDTVDLKVNGRIQSNNNGGGMWVGAESSGRFVGGNSDAGGIGFYKGGWSLLALDNGNVGIGTVTPGAGLTGGMVGGLTINGTGATQLTVEKGGTPAFALNVDNGKWTMYDKYGGNWNPSITSKGGSIGIGQANPNPSYKLEVAGNIGASGFFYTSDKSLKNNIEPLQNSLSKILQLQGVSFNWKDTGRSDVGLVAQDVEKIFPEIVNTKKSTGLKSVEYGNLVAPLIEAVKEQQKEIDLLKSEIRDLQNKK